ncbi:MAG: methylmalonyl Co-A mutase-associated GTPase MeaB [Promethearchaeota archaeon]
MLSKEKKEEIDNLIEKLFMGNKRAIARLMTYIEEDIDKSAYIIEKIYPHTGNAYIIGITGAPGSGKSSLISAMIEHYVKQGHRVGVVAVDPTSPFSGGAILGDRIRMKKSFSLDQVFIRSMANRGQLGGIARATKDLVKVLDAANYDIILIETVGVGQSEVDIFKAAYTTVVVVIPGLGDEIQAIKAGIMEITDIFVVNKMDLPGADKKVRELNSMLDLSEKIQVNNQFHSVKVVKNKEWRPPIIKTNALTNQNIDQFLELIETHKKFLYDSGFIKKKLNIKFKNEILDIIKYKIEQHIENLIYHNPKINTYIEKIVNKNADPYMVSNEIIEKFAKIFDELL